MSAEYLDLVATGLVREELSSDYRDHLPEALLDLVEKPFYCFIPDGFAFGSVGGAAVIDEIYIDSEHNVYIFSEGFSTWRGFFFPALKFPCRGKRWQFVYHTSPFGAEEQRLSSDVHFGDQPKMEIYESKDIQGLGNNLSRRYFYCLYRLSISGKTIAGMFRSRVTQVACDGEHGHLLLNFAPKIQKPTMFFQYLSLYKGSNPHMSLCYYYSPYLEKPFEEDVEIHFYTLAI
ncbi:MAG: hypothetical protein PHW01_03990 [Patescibacteria group bacterium]|nr:hypothetical protein [Patescibacteria group bacterium]